MSHKSKKFNDKALLKKLKKAQERDPGFKKAIQQFVEAEVRIKDPVEGKLVKSPKKK